MKAERGHIIIAGSGYAGSILASILRRLDYRVTILEKGTHPRFAIGESSTPVANFFLELLGDKFGLPWLRQLSSYGRWRKYHPNLPVGLKRGFTFYFHEPGSDQYAIRPARIAASPEDLIADTHWYRPDLDHFLVRQAVGLGAALHCSTTIRSIDITASGVCVKAEYPSGSSEIFEGDFLIDATGSPEFGKLLNNRAAIPIPGYPGRSGLYAHFSGVARMDDLDQSLEPERQSNSIPIPYPSDDAAVHHVFEGGWIWVLRFNNGITSAGASLAHGDTFSGYPTDPYQSWNQLLDRFPIVKSQFTESELLMRMGVRPSLSWRLERGAGSGWACLPSSFSFTDPILSSGFALTLLGIWRLAEAADKTRLSVSMPPDYLESYEINMKADAETAARMTSALLNSGGQPNRFKSALLVYFCAAIQYETRLRLGRISPDSGFMYRDCREWHELGMRLLTEDIPLGECSRALDPWDLGGITIPNRDFQLPASIDDLIRNRHKIPADESEILRMAELARII